MKKIPLFTFASFVAGSPSTKLSCVADFKNATSYNVRTDWYKQIREFLPRNHREGGSKAELRAFLNSVTGRKAENYASVGGAYLRWWGSRNLKWFPGSKSVEWKAGELAINVNPELFVSIDGVRHVVKLYFKSSERLTADRVNTTLRLLELAYRGGSSPEGRPEVGILDLSGGNMQFHTPDSSLAYLDPLLHGEASSFITIYEAA